MSTFELATDTKAKITNVVVLSQKNRAPDDNPFTPEDALAAAVGAGAAE